MDIIVVKQNNNELVVSHDKYIKNKIRLALNDFSMSLHVDLTLEDIEKLKKSLDFISKFIKNNP